MMQEAFFDNSFGRSFSFGFTVIPIIITIMFVLILTVFVVVFLKVFSQWNKNNHAPRLTVDATVVSKRTDFSHSSGHHNHTTGMHSSGA